MVIINWKCFQANIDVSENFIGEIEENRIGPDQRIFPLTYHREQGQWS